MVDSDHRSQWQQIYSLPPLAAREIPQISLQELELANGVEPSTCWLQISCSAIEPRQHDWDRLDSNQQPRDVSLAYTPSKARSSNHLSYYLIKMAVPEGAAPSLTEGQSLAHYCYAMGLYRSVCPDCQASFRFASTTMTSNCSIGYGDSDESWTRVYSVTGYHSNRWTMEP